MKKENIVTSSINQKHAIPELLNDEYLSTNLTAIREQRIILPGREKYLYPMLEMEINIKSVIDSITELIIVSFCPNPNEAAQWIRFSIPVTDNKIEIDFWDIMKNSDNKDPEAIGYYSWHYTDGFLINFMSKDHLSFNLVINEKEKIE